MEEDEIHQTQACKFPRVGNSRNESNKYPNEELEDGGGGELRRRGCDDNSTNLNRFNNNWHHSSRIIRVSRASGGKDRHSKVMTSKGLRDRRVRLSVTTAIQFYDLQDRLGYDQPSKAVEWLIKSASDAISELPSLNNTFPDTPKQPSDEKRASFVGTEHGFDSADAEMENGTPTENGENNYQQNNNQSQNNLSLSKSACSSTSETSKGSGLSLSRSDIRVNRVKARERARERTAKEKEKENDSHNNTAHHQHNVNSISQTASFTELLTGGMNNTANSDPRGGGGDEINLFQKATRQQWSSAAAPMDYFSPVILGPSSSSSSRNHHHQNSSGFSLSQIQLGHNSLPDNAMSMSSVSLSPFSTSDQLQQHYSFIPHDHHHHHHLMPAVVTSQPTGNNNDYNLNFTISSGLAGYNRGTLQSNSPSSLLPHLQRFSPSLDGSSTVPFFMGAAPASASAAPTMENNHQHHHQFSSVFDGSSRLHLYYGDGCRHSDQKGKSKN